MGNRTAKKPATAEITEDVAEFEEEFSVEDAIEQMGNEARQVFDLRDKLKGISKSVKPKAIPVFMDLDAVAARNIIAKQCNDLKAQLDFFEGSEDVADEVTASTRAKLDALLPQLEDADKLMLQSALSVLLKPVPRVVIKDARRKGKKLLGIDSGKVPAGLEQDYDEAVNLIVLSKMIQEVRDAEGNLYSKDAKALQDGIPDSQWTKILRTMNQLSFEDAVASTATDDPGF
jgi:hypothetical protein